MTQVSKAFPRLAALIGVLLFLVVLGLVVTSKIVGEPGEQFILYRLFFVSRMNSVALSALAMVVAVCWPWIRIYLVQTYFVLTVLLVVFSFGFVVGKHKTYPYNVVYSVETVFDDARKAAFDWREYWQANLGLRPERSLRKARHQGARVVGYVPGKAYPGVTFLTNVWEGSPAMALVDMNGKELHKWLVSFNEIWGDATHYSGKARDTETLIDGAVLYPNGDIVFNFQYKGLAKIDRCSNVIWKVPRVTHHSVYKDGQGNLWVPGLKHRKNAADRFPLFTAPIDEEFILVVSPDGEVLKEISLIDVIFESTYEGLLFADRRANVGHGEGDDKDITHINDIEILEPSVSENFELFDAGDIIVSMRVLNLLVVIDAVTERIKWSMTGPYLRQHDPDYLSSGRILVFDNRSDSAEGKVLGGSRILEIDPVTQKRRVVYEGKGKDTFFTSIGGKQQKLPNGNVLITEFGAGRAFEVTPDQEVVWSFINRWNEEEVVVLTEATRYPESYAAFAEEACQ